MKTSLVSFRKNAAPVVTPPVAPSTPTNAVLEDVKKSLAEANKAIDAARDPKVIDALVKVALEKQMAAFRPQPRADYAVDGDPGVQTIEGDPEFAKECYVVKAARPEQHELREFQDWQDSIYVLKSLMRKQGRDVRMTKIYQRGVKRYGRFVKALDTTTANQGTDWLPTIFSGQLTELVRLKRLVPGLFPETTMPAKAFTFPVEKADLSAVILSESTSDDATALSASQPTTTNVTLTATKLGRRVVVSEEFDEDSIIAVMPWLRNQTAIAIATGLEDAILNGDTTTPHQDEDVAAASSNDVRKAWKGLRKYAIANSFTLTASNAAPTDALLVSTQLLMGKYGVAPSDCVLICGPKGYAKLRSITQVRTLDVYGPQATILTGELARWAGIPVIVSEKCREVLNASGVDDATTNDRGVLHLVNRSSFTLGTRRKVTVKTWEKVETDQLIMVVTWRGDFKPYYPQTEGMGAMLYNIALA